MDKRIVFVALTVILLAFVAVMAFAQNSTNVRWEYTALSSRELTSDGIIRRANALGQEGWELVTSTASISSPAPGLLIFKRRL
jgi:hypothetical protein